MMLRAVAACVVAAGCISPVMKFGGGKTAKEAQHDTMAEFSPAHLVTGETWKGEVTTRKIRVWADDQYRAQNRQWQKSFEEPLELANLVITPILGVRFVADYMVWEHNVPGATLTDALTALIARDPGDDVFATIGLTSSLPLVSATFDELGLATLGGRHIAVRGYADIEERKKYLRAFEKRLLDEEVHVIYTLQWHRIIPHSSKVKGWTITPSHYLNNQLDTVWLTE